MALRLDVKLRATTFVHDATAHAAVMPAIEQGEFRIALSAALHVFVLHPQR